MPKPTLAERLWSKFTRTDNGCWEWTGAKFKTGYGAIKIGGRSGRTMTTHRVMYELIVGPIPDGLQIDHLCRNRACCNPMHMEPVTMAENLRRAPSRSYMGTHCLHGHEYTPENTVRDREGHRMCRTCRNAQRRKSFAKTKG